MIVQQILRGDVRAAARLMRRVDDGDPAAAKVLHALFSETGKAHIVGVTGNPGAGKSTLVDMLIQAFRRTGRTVGVVAVDASSPFSGGAILGDRIRMQRHATDPGVFIHSLATRGHLGGLSRSTNDVITIMDSMGFDLILVETVGVGQDEVDIVKTAHTSVVVLVPGMGDDIQIMKAGILEIADIFVVNKADRPGAEKLVAELEALQKMLSDAQGHKQVPIIKTVAPNNQGVEELSAEIDRHKAFLAKSGQMAFRERTRLFEAVASIARESFDVDFRTVFEEMDRTEGILQKLVDRKMSPYEISMKIVNTFRHGE